MIIYLAFSIFFLLRQSNDPTKKVVKLSDNNDINVFFISYRYTLTKTQLHAQWNIFDEMTGMKCAVDGELFGVLYLQEEDALRPDDAAGRLLYRNVSSVWLQVADMADSVSNKVYEAPVEKVESECVVLRLSSKMCSDLKLYDTCDTDVNAQFQLNRRPLCEMHAAVDRLTKGQLRLIFPEPRTETVKSDVSHIFRN